jgi:integrase
VRLTTQATNGASPAKPRVQVERTLTREARAFAMRMLGALPNSAAAARMRFVLALTYSTGLRRAALCGALNEDISVRYAGAELGSIHLLRMVGKGAKERFIPLVPPVLEALGDHLEAQDFPRDPLACPVGTPLIPALPDNQDIGPSADIKRLHGVLAGHLDTARTDCAKATKGYRLSTAGRRIRRSGRGIHRSLMSTPTGVMRSSSPGATTLNACIRRWIT